MRPWLKRTLWISAAFIVVWTAAIVFWQNTSRLPAQSDLLLSLAGLPLLLIGVGWGAYTLATHPSALPIDNHAAAKAQTDKLEVEKTQRDSEQQRNRYLNIVATALQTSAGSSASEVLAKLEDGDVPAELDPELKNEEGFAVFSARIADLDVSTTQDALSKWAKHTRHAELVWSDAQLRSLHLASVAIDELGPVTGAHRDVQVSFQQIASGRAPDEDAIPVSKLILLWPERWGAAHESAASGWAKTLVVQHGWPDRRVLVADNSQTQASPVELLDQMCVMGGKTKLPAIGLMLACDSGIDQSEVDVLISRNQLFGGKNPAGSKPGEVVAALLVADEKQSRLFSEKELSKLHRASWGFREKSADERGKISAALPGSVVLQAVQTSGTTVESIQFVSSDNDHKPSREAELAQMFFAKLPDLDCLKDTVKVAQTCGSSQRALTSAALCLAHQYVITEKMPADSTSWQH